MNMSEPGPSPTDRAVKRERVQAILTARGVDGLVLTSHGAIAWYLDGIRSHVGLAGDPVLAVLVANGVDTVVVYANERARLEVEELPSDVLVHAVAWHEPLSTAWATVPGLLREVDVAAELRAARASLLPAELARFRQLSADAACVLTDVLGGVAPQQSERSSDDMRRDLAPDFGVVIRQPFLGDPCIRPVDAVGMGQLDGSLLGSRLPL